MILNLTQHPATPEQIAQGLVDYPDRRELQELLTIEEDDMARGPWTLGDNLDDKVADLVNIVVVYQAMALDNVPEELRGIDKLVAFRDAISLKVLVGGATILMERLIPALKREGCIPVHALPNGHFMDAL